MLYHELFSGILFLFSGYCLYYVTTTVQVSTVSDPLGSAFWPQMILVLLMVMLAVNMWQVYKGTAPDKRDWGALGKVNWAKALTSPLGLGMIGMFAYSWILGYTGFLPTSFVLCMFFCYLLGERRKWVIVLASLATVIGLYLLFYKGMGIQMPRGTIPFLRKFAMGVEKLLRFRW